MNKKTLILLLSIISMSTNAVALVSFEVKNTPFIGKLMVEDNLMLITDKKQDFIVLYNKKNEVVYYKHKNLPATYKVPLLKIVNSRFMSNLKQEKTELNLLGYKTKLSSVKMGGRECFQVYGSRDLGDSFGSSLSSAYAIYQGFVYMTAQMQMAGNCKEVSLSSSFDSKAGFPLAAFYNAKEVKLDNLKNEKQTIKEFLKNNSIHMKKAYKPTLKLQYEMLYSLLDEQQQKAFDETSKDKTIAIKIKAIDNLLKGF